MLVYGELSSQAGVAVGDNLAINSFVCWLFWAITLASASSVLSLCVSWSHILSRIFCTPAVLDAIIAAVFCCHARIAFSMLLFVLQNHWVIRFVWFWIAFWAANCCCQNELLLINSTVLSWLLLLLANHAIHAALLLPNQNQLPFHHMNRNSIKIISHVPMFQNHNCELSIIVISMI
jgi:hypothetical protein